MREIKFRAWDKHEERMGEVSYIKFPKFQYPFISARFYNKQNGKMVDESFYFNQEDGSDNVILMQYTGLHDKNGREIYEGDIYHQGDKKILYVVVWRDTSLIGKQVKANSYAGLLYWKDRIEVIGNICENPELLEVSECQQKSSWKMRQGVVQGY